MRVGSEYLGNGKCRFTVWAPKPEKIEVRIISHDNRTIPMKKDERDYWTVTADNINPGTHYYYLLNGETERPDPASSYQPKGVHGPSEVIDHNNFIWANEDKNWQGIPQEKYIIYEMHVGTFTPEGTFEAASHRLDDLLELGINCIEIMPVAQFPGERNWGYDGTYLYAPQNSYGGPDGLKRLVNECHKKGIAVCLDVVYNHFGPEGNYSGEYGPYLTDRYKSPWGQSVNFDGEYGSEVGNFFVENALHWFRNYHIDALRLDAVHAIIDTGAKHILRRIAEAAEKYSKEAGRKFYLIAESDLNDTRLLKPDEQGGYGLDAQWSDDFHHSLRTLLTGEKHGYYMDYGNLEHFRKTMEEGYYYADIYSKHRKRLHGNSPSEIEASKFVVYCQNHDQVGNRMLGDRLAGLVDHEALLLAAGAYLLSPYIPMLFMGEEYGEDNPFQYFVHHSDENLIEGVRKGRKEEFAAFHAEGEAPDPQSEKTFQRSKPDWNKKNKEPYSKVYNWYKTLINLRKNELPLPDKKNMKVKSFEEQKVITMERWDSSGHVYILMNFSKEEVKIPAEVNGNFIKVIDSAENKWGGKGESLPERLGQTSQLTLKPYNFAVYKSEETL